MRKYPEIGWVQYIRRWAAETKDGMFWCEICGRWVNNQRWAHYKKFHLKYV